MTAAGLRTLIFSSLILCPGFSTTVTNAPLPVYPTPSASQMAWHEMEQNAFIHFSINTFTDKEWGYGDETESAFNPTALDATQWARTLKAAGFKGVILTCKHHDGFCLWPSALTEHSVKNSPYKNGKGDVVKEVAAAVKAEGMKFGIYVSPWDRNQATYGTSSYIDFYRAQLKELFTAYGPVFEMWFDGANGGDGYYGGAREKRQINGSAYYHWPETLDSVRKFEPGILFFSDAGPGVRWVGNERGVAGETNWNTISPDTLFAGKAGIESLLNSGHEKGTEWIPAEVDVSIRPGWFYHASEDDKVKTPEELFNVWMTSVGRGSTLLLNVPPDRRGRIHKNDSVALTGWRELIRRRFAVNLARDKPATSRAVRGNSARFDARNVTDNNPDTYWCTDDEVTTATVEIDLEQTVPVSYIVLQEYIRLGQRVRHFKVEALENTRWKIIFSGTTIGYKRILAIPSPITTDRIRVTISDAKACPALSAIEVF